MSVIMVGESTHLRSWMTRTGFFSLGTFFLSLPTCGLILPLHFLPERIELVGTGPHD